MTIFFIYYIKYTDLQRITWNQLITWYQLCFGDIHMLYLITLSLILYVCHKYLLNRFHYRKLLLWTICVENFFPHLSCLKPRIFKAFKSHLNILRHLYSAFVLALQYLFTVLRTNCNHKLRFT